MTRRLFRLHLEINFPAGSKLVSVSLELLVKCDVKCCVWYTGVELLHVDTALEAGDSLPACESEGRIKDTRGHVFYLVYSNKLAIEFDLILLIFFQKST